VSVDERDDSPPSEPPPSTRVLRVRAIEGKFGIFAFDTQLTPDRYDTREAAVAAARELTGGRGALILVEGADGLDAEAIPPSSAR
jgi:hypothetical protein